jgi:hypothetical protein
MSAVSSKGKGKDKEKPIASLVAGAMAGGVESFVTFPLESLKTQLQFGALEGGKVGRLSCISLSGPFCKAAEASHRLRAVDSFFLSECSC